AEHWNEALEVIQEAVSQSSSSEEKTELLVMMGRWYAEHLMRPDFALACLKQALSLDPTHREAVEAIAKLFRASQSWTELVESLLAQADLASSPVSARELRVDAARVLLSEIKDMDRALSILREVYGAD